MSKMKLAMNFKDADWWRGCTIYQIYPRSFQDTTGNGVGDLNGVKKRLAHVAALGVDAIWLSPFFTSPMADMGYDVSDYCGVDPLFGTLADFDGVVAEAHHLGLKVVIDQVLSHSSDQHPWFKESRASRKNPRSDWYVWADARPDGTAPNNWLSVFGGPAWEWDSVRRQYYLHQFLASQPDLNFHNPQVQKALLGALKFWLDRGVDGFRLDTVNHYFHDRGLRDNPPVKRGKTRDVPETNPYGLQDHLYDKSRPENIPFLKRFRALLDSYGDRMSVGEVGDADRSLRTVAAYTEGGDKLHMCYTFDLLGPEFSASHVRASVEAFETIVRDGWVCWAFSNHDVTRHVSRWGRQFEDAEAVARFAIALLCTLRGSICLYQGEELGLTEADLAFDDLRDPYGIRFWPGYKGRDGSRTPMPWEAAGPNASFSTAKPWLPVSKEHLANAVDHQEGRSGSVLEHYRSMLSMRKATPVLATGDIRFVGRRSKTLLSFIRGDGDGEVFCAFNFGDRPGRVVLPGPVSPLDGPATSKGLEIAERSATLPALSWLIARLR